MKKIIVILLPSIMLFLLTGCLWGTFQLADTVGRNNIGYTYHGSFAGYMSEDDKELADSLGLQKIVVGGEFFYGLTDFLDMELGVQGSNLGAGVKLSPKLNIPVRFALNGAIYNDFANYIITPKAGAIVSWHISNNVTFTTGGQAYFNNDNIGKEIFASVDLSRGDLFNHVIPDNIFNLLIPKAIQFNASYPLMEDSRRLYMGIGLRHQFDFFKKKSV